jgi:S1-C subfamily serine protease
MTMPAEAAGLKRGDLIREMDSTSMTSLSGLIRVVSSKAVGAPLFIRISRDGVLKDYTLILREKKEYRALRSQLDALFNRYGIEIDENSDRKDVIVSYVSPRGLAYDLRRGDIIISLNGVNIFSLDDFARAFSMASRVIREMRVYRDSAIHTIEFTRARQ